MRARIGQDTSPKAPSASSPTASPKDHLAQFEQARGFHRQGQLDGAEILYRALLEKYPKDFDLLHMLGTVQGQRNNFDAAIELIEQAVQIDPNSAPAHCSLGNCLKGLGKCAEALASYDRALALTPNDADALNNRGATLRELNRPEEALASFDRALAINPNHVVALDNRGTTLRELKQPAAALASHDQALAISSGYVAAHCNRGNVLSDLKRYEEARVSFEHALTLDPRNIDALNSLGMVLAMLGRHEEALVSCDKALALNTENPVSFCNRGAVLDGLKRYEDALVSYDRALALKAGYADAYNNRGAALKALRRHTEALGSFDNGLAANPDHPPLRFNRGILLFHAKRAEEAVRDFERVVQIEPAYDFARGYLLHTRMSCCDWHDLSDLSSAIDKDVQDGRKSAEPFCYLAISNSPAVLKRCAEICLTERSPLTTDRPAPPRPRRNSKIRLGYVAGEYREHATSFLLAELFEKHDNSRFDLFAFDNGWDDGSDIRKRLENAFNGIMDISRLSDSDAAHKILFHDIDILVDLNGHVGLKRPGVFSRRPAPVLVNWLGFPGTMGAPYMDYIIGDANVIPAGHEAYYSEKVVRLPDTYQVNDSKRVIAERTPTRAEAKLPESGFVFCCFNNNYKITPEVFDVWMRLLSKADRSVLWLLEDNPAASRNLRAQATARGVAPERLVFAPRMDLAEHLARHKLADLFLDTLPCNAHTTASDALWAGLPLLTCMGSTFAGRVAGSLLHAIGLPELVTHNLADYEALALKLAPAPHLLSDLRARLAQNRITHPLFDTDRFRRHIESAYATMHERRLNGQTPASFAVAPVV